MTLLESSTDSMPLSSMDISAAMNFLPCQAGSNTFTILSGLPSPENPAFSPWPTTPFHDSNTEAQSYTSHYSNSIVQTQTIEPERSSHDQRVSLTIQTTLMPGPGRALLSPVESDATVEMPMSPTDSQLTRGSSVYSTESAHSSDSLETSISQIVDMYTDLINKIPVDDSVEGVQILHPRAYRDTLTPLLKRRFSDEDSPTPPPSQQTIPALHVKKEPSSTSLVSNSKQAPAFQEFSRNLKDKRAELVSPLSANSTYDNHMTLDSLSELSPMSTHGQRFSFSSDTTGDTSTVKDHRSVSPLQSDTNNVRPEMLADTVTRNTLHQTKLERVQRSPPNQLRFVQSQDISDRRKPEKLEFAHEVCQSPPRQMEPVRFYENHAGGSDYSENLITYNGISDTAKAMVKDKLNRRKEARERNDVNETAGRKYPGANPEGWRQRPFSHEKQEACKDGSSSSVIPGKARNDLLGQNLSSTQPQRREKQAAISLTPYQMYGTEAWKAENKLKKEEPQLNSSKPKLRPKSSDTYQRKHGRTSSSKSAESVDSHGLREKKNSFIAALGGAKMSLTSSSADKRREKLKDSIVIVGPTHLSVDHALNTGKSLP